MGMFDGARSQFQDRGGNVHKERNHNNNKGAKQMGNPSKCGVCGRNHPESCLYASYKCRKSGVEGHLERSCRKATVRELNALVELCEENEVARDIFKEAIQRVVQ